MDVGGDKSKGQQGGKKAGNKETGGDKRLTAVLERALQVPPSLSLFYPPPPPAL